MEARDAVNTIKDERIINCDTKGQYFLGKLTAINPYLRTIIIGKNNDVWCSSLAGNSLAIIGKITPPQHPLDLVEVTANDKKKTKQPILIYRVALDDKVIFITISDAYLRSILDSSEIEMNASIIVNDLSLQSRGPLSHYKEIPTWYNKINSIKHPFIISYQPSKFINFSRMFHQGGVMILLMIITFLGVMYLVKYVLTKFYSLTESLRKAIVRGEIVPYYQPIINCQNGKIYGVEVLARWEHKTHGPISPDTFINLAEKNGLIIKLTNSLMKQVSLDINNDKFKKRADFHVGINISAQHFKSENFVHDCKIFKSSINDENITIVLEITEREELIINNILKNKLTTLYNEGFLLALDDFGTGYSGLSYLNDIQVDYLKIDKSFVSKISNDSNSLVLLNSVIDLAQRLSIKVIAEGVENELQVSYLRKRDIMLMQGYYFSKPVPASKLLDMIT